MSAPVVGAFRLGLKETGCIEGQNVVVEYRWAGFGTHTTVEARESLRRGMREMNKRFRNPQRLNPNAVARRGVLAEAYLVYAQLSFDAHPSLMTLQQYIVKMEEDGQTVRGIDISPVPKPTDARDAIDLACQAVIGVCVGANQILGFTKASAQLRSIAGKYSKLAGIAK